ncbi:hypothetical protein Tco_1057351 [Tanacetum coccineum]|uniref:Uncharacterized protein n=1 Tax=Tanacetum coccineum TaxID=301880 RepID=A0ABQ5H6H0_9ASTR
MTDALLANVQATQVIEDTHVIITVVTLEVQQQSSSVSSSFISNMLNPNLDTGIDSILNLNTESTSLVDVPVTTNAEKPPSSITTLPPPPIPLIQHLQQTPFEDRVKALEDDFLEFKQTNLFAEAVSSISDRLRDEAQAENEHFINKLDENIKKIIKEQVKVQVKEQVSKILLRIKKSVNKQLEAEVLTRSFNKAKTSHAVAANLSELELKKILIDKMENNKSIDRSVQQKTFYKALVDAYETDKDILKTYGDTVKFKRRQDNEDEDEEPSAGSNRGSKRRRAGKEPESSSAPKEKTSKSTGKSKEGSRSHQAEEPTYTIEDLEKPAHQEFNTGFTEDQPVDETTQFPDCNLALKEDPRESCNESMDTPLDFSTFVLNRLKVDSLTLELLAGPTFELMKVMKTKVADYGHIKWIEDLVPNTMWSQVPIITVRRDDDKLYTFKEGDYKILRPQDIKDMLLLLVQGKLKNLTIKERLALGVSLRMFTRSIVLKRRVEDLQLGVESYQKKLNLTKPDTYRSDLKRKIAYTIYSNPKGFIYQNKDKKNRLKRIDELHKFSDGTLNDVWSALDDILKRTRMKYLPQTVWRNVDKERAGAMIQAIDQQLLINISGTGGS